MCSSANMKSVIISAEPVDYIQQTDQTKREVKRLGGGVAQGVSGNIFV